MKARVEVLYNEHSWTDNLQVRMSKWKSQDYKNTMFLPTIIVTEVYAWKKDDAMMYDKNQVVLDVELADKTDAEYQRQAIALYDQWKRRLADED